MHNNVHKVVPLFAIEAWRGEGMLLHLHLSLTSTLDGSEWSASCISYFTARRGVPIPFE